MDRICIFEGRRPASANEYSRPMICSIARSIMIGSSSREEAGSVHVLRDQEAGDVGEEPALVDDEDVELAGGHRRARA